MRRAAGDRRPGAEPLAGCRRALVPLTVADRARVPGLEIAPDPLQIRAQVGRRLVAQLAILLEAVVDDLLQAQRQLRIQRDRRDRRPVQDRGEDHRRRLARERLAAGRALVQHDAEREQVGAAVERSPRACSGDM